MWVERLKEEYQALIKYVTVNKEADNDWFRLESNKEGTRWFGKCWHIENLLKYEFEIEFDIPGEKKNEGRMHNHFWVVRPLICLIFETCPPFVLH